MRNLAEPGSRFRAAAPNHPEALLEPQAFQAVGEQWFPKKTGVKKMFWARAALNVVYFPASSERQPGMFLTLPNQICFFDRFLQTSNPPSKTIVAIQIQVLDQFHQRTHAAGLGLTRR